MAMLFASVLTCVASALVAFAAPASHCSTAGDKLILPGNTSALPAPPAGAPSFVALGVGVQNYTCASTGLFSSTGAVAELFNLACLPAPDFNPVTDAVFAAWEIAPRAITAQELIGTLAVFHPSVVLGQHYFIVNPVSGSGLSAKWDFTSASEKGHPDAFVVGMRTGDVVAPTDPAVNIDWLSLSAVPNIGGDLAADVYRVQTRGGQPPTSCTPGKSKDISVRYVSQYWFFGGAF
ncbi:hypothetical protein PsYK624_088310 [Phanerochaete sordida]|uniref:Malate dehydrogenase n=1 Tax=Phanerochaete sordida TaxID=48140 RepID=A0A9P3GD28_9APHY|nr:hypothetical protein PsYK624_088310 [Phanerochaete sordida]